MITSSQKLLMARAGAGPEPSGWTDPDLGNASYDSVSFGYQAQEEQGTDIFFKPDGTVLYVMGETGDAINQYSLSTAWDISTASYVQNFSVSSQEINPRGLFFKPDGTKMYVCGINGDDVNEYSLSTAWDISTASYVQNFSVSAQEASAAAIFFKPDGKKMFIGGATGDDVNEYSLSSAWDISTASYSQSFSISSQETNIGGLYFSPDGTKMFLVGSGADAVFQYSLSTGWDVSSASYDSISFSVASQGTVPVGLFFKSDGSKMYVIDVVQDAVFQYSTAAAAPVEWIDPDLANASYDSVSFSVAGQETSVFDLYFREDGLTMYVVGWNQDGPREYSLSTPWDISTASYVQGFSITAQDTVPTGLFFKPDGSKLYVISQGVDSVHEYNIGTAWDISTSSYVRSFSIAAQEVTPRCLFFSPDGTKMYFAGTIGDDINEYNLSTAWDISTASFSTSFLITSQETGPTGFFFNYDGTKLYVTGTGSDAVHGYTLSTAWNVSTASYDSIAFSVASQDTAPAGLFFKSDGAKMYITGSTTDTIYQYSTA